MNRTKLTVNKCVQYLKKHRNHPLVRKLAEEYLLREKLSAEQKGIAARSFMRRVIDEMKEIKVDEDKATRGYKASEFITVPLFPIHSTPAIHISQIKNRRFNIIDRLKDVIGTFVMDITNIIKKDIHGASPITGITPIQMVYVTKGSISLLPEIDYTDPNCRLQFGLEVEFVAFGQSININREEYLFIPDDVDKIMHKGKGPVVLWGNYQDVVNKCFETIMKSANEVVEKTD